MLVVSLALAGPLAIPATPEDTPETPDAPPVEPASPVEPAPVPVRPAPAPKAPRRDLTASLAAYQSRAVSIRSYRTYSGGAGRMVGWGYGWPGWGNPYVGMSTMYVIRDPLIPQDHWAVYQGNDRLTVPMWMDLADAPEERDDLRRRIRRTRGWHGAFVTLAVAGAVTAVGASYGSQAATTYDQYDDWNLAISGGLTALAGGIAGAYGTGVHARTLRYDFDRTQDLGRTWMLVDEHNARVRSELGLTPADTAPFDEPPPPR